MDTIVDAPAGMVSVPGGEFTMGSNEHYREERPAHQVTTAPFFIDRHAVTNDAFAEFVSATGHVTTAEMIPDRDTAPPDMPEAYFVAASLVFTKPAAPVPLTDFRAWWQLVPGACWRHPEGPDSTLDGRGAHPVVQVSHDDASAYAAWAGKSLPSEREWEFAARGGRDTTYPWGDNLVEGGTFRANTWQGAFPAQNSLGDGFEGAAPVDAFGPTGYGTFNMLGNVWEWTTDRYGNHHEPGKTCCTPSSTDTNIVNMVVKGGSYLCAPNYCRRYRPTARTPQERLSSTNHLGFRCVIR